MVTEVKTKEGAMTTTNELKPLLKRLKLGHLLKALPERLALARREQLDYAAFLQIILADEETWRDNRNLEMHFLRRQDSRKSAAWRILTGQLK